MADTTIRVSEETKRRLELARRDDESFEDVIRRLASTDHWTGFGILADEDGETRAGVRQIREQMRDGMEHDDEEKGGS